MEMKDFLCSKKEIWDEEERTRKNLVKIEVWLCMRSKFHSLPDHLFALLTHRIQIKTNNTVGFYTNALTSMHPDALMCQTHLFFLFAKIWCQTHLSLLFI